MKCVSLVVTFLLSLSAFGKLPKTEWQIQNGRAVYHVNYPLKKVEGVSEQLKGKGQCSNGTCQFLIAVPVKSFGSGDGNRDNHMLEVTKAAENPMVTVQVTIPDDLKQETVKTQANVGFAGRQHSYEISIKIVVSQAGAKASGTLPLKLSDFNVERPSLFAVKIDDLVPVDFELNWN